MSTAFGIALESFVILALVLANGFFVAAEFALVKVRASQLQPLAKQGSWRVRFALRATKHLDAALSATQLGITLASLGLGWLGEPFVAARLEPLLGRIGIYDPASVESIAFAVAFGLITFFHIIIGELAPKSLAIQRAQGVALWVSAPLMVFYFLFYPFIWLLNGAANLCLRWAGLAPTSEAQHAFSPEELEYVFSHARHSHPGDAVVNKLMLQSLRIRRTTALQIMVPREQVITLRVDAPPAENLRAAQQSGHSRFPVCAGSPDDVRGIVVVREWLWQQLALGPDAGFEGLVRPALTFRIDATIPAMMEEFRSARMHLAIVRDAQNRFAGIVTFEDVLEEIVGDIRDEFDIHRGPVFAHTPNAIVVSGSFTMRELQAETGWTFEWLPRETVAAWIVRRSQRKPRRGDEIEVDEYALKIEEATGDQLRRIRVERRAPAE